MSADTARYYLVEADLVRAGVVIAAGVFGVVFEGTESLNEIGEAALIVEYVWQVPIDFDERAFTTDDDAIVECEEGDHVQPTSVEREKR